MILAKEDLLVLNHSYLLGWLSTFAPVIDGKFLPERLPAKTHLIYLDDEIYDVSQKTLPENLLDGNHVYICKIKWVHDYLTKRGHRSILFPWFHVIDDAISMHFLQHDLRPVYPSDREKTFFCLNRGDRPHRRLLVDTLKAQNVLDKGLVTFRETDLQITELYRGDNLDHYVCGTVGFERHQSEVNGIGVSAPVANTIKINTHYLQPINIAAETVSWFEFFPTEKSVLAFATKRIPLIVAGRGRVKSLKDQGFETFDWLVNHDYDDLSDYQDRIIRLVDRNIDILANGVEVDHNVKDAMDHNYDFYINGWLDAKLSELQQKIQSVLNHVQ